MGDGFVQAAYYNILDPKARVSSLIRHLPSQGVKVVFRTVQCSEFWVFIIKSVCQESFTINKCKLFVIVEETHIGDIIFFLSLTP